MCLPSRHSPCHECKVSEKVGELFNRKLAGNVSIVFPHLKQEDSWESLLQSSVLSFQRVKNVVVVAGSPVLPFRTMRSHGE